ncbi:hypothetical protein VU06_02240 [Desulfobulbus sp. F3]|nr:hypothetical protein [Desulfobulbus sp. F3]
MPYAAIIRGTVTASELVRIQVVFDVREDCLMFSLIDMHEGGKAGAEVAVATNGELTLQGFSGSAVSSLDIRVNDYAALKAMIRSSYGGRVADVLDARVG